MIKKRFIYDGLHVRDILNEIPPILTHTDNQRDEFLNGLNNLYKENEQLKQKMEDLLYQIGEADKNNKTCRRFITNNGVFYKDIETGWEFQSYGEVVELLNKLNDENKTFRAALKELKEIGDYQAMRIKELDDENRLIEDEIDKKIAVLTDAKIKSFQNGDEELLKKIKFSIQVLRELKEVFLK